LTSTLLVVGLGRETRDWLDAGHAAGTDVLVLDERTVDPADPTLAALRGRVTVRSHVDLDAPLPDLDPGDLAGVVRSPGVSPYRRALADVVASGVPTCTPTGWWLARDQRPGLVAITGTKGKSTTAAMTTHVLQAVGQDVVLCGNIGRTPFTGVTGTDQLVVIELSSYQLADLEAAIPIAGLTTLLRDHVPWHGSLERYHADKLRLLDLADRRLATRTAAEHPRVAPRIDAIADVAAQRERLTAAVHAAGLLGDHLVDDAALAVALADAVLAATGQRPAPGDLLDALHDFAPLPHRLTPVGEVAGVRYVDDSISTVPEAAMAALAAYRGAGPVTLLLGGDDRGQELDELAAAVVAADALPIVTGALAGRLTEALTRAGGTPIAADDLPAAVRTAADRTPPGGTVLLSPAAPSFGTHRDFVHRGEHFTELVHALPGGLDRPSAGGRRTPPGR
jgi:UDP-N-acetylmuramoylalanine--D-glutamate ligase